MGWITRGKVNVALNSAVVTGVGSLFLQDGRIGDGFRGPDGRMYEVANIATNTGLTIQPPYEGPTVNNATYYLAPFEGYVKDTADALRAASLQIGQFPLTKQDKSDNLTALSGLTGAADRLPYFTGAGALSLATLTAKARLFNARTDAAGMRAEITAASSGANSDITRLSGLTTALSIAQGGTGGTTQAAARTGLGLGSSATLDYTGTGAATRIAKDPAIMSKVTDGTWRGLGGFLDLRGTFLESGTPFEVLNIGFVTGFVQLSNMGITPAILPGALYGHLTIVTPLNGTSGLVGQTTIRTVRSGQYETVSYATSDTTWSAWSEPNVRGGANSTITSLSGLTSITSSVVMSLPTKLATFTVATLPSAPLYSGCTIMVSNAAGGAKQCTSNGTVWQITNTTTTVS